MSQKNPKFRVGQIVTIHVNSEYDGRPIVFEVEGKIISVNGKLFAQLKNGMQAPVSSLRGPAKGGRK